MGRVRPAPFTVRAGRLAILVAASCAVACPPAGCAARKGSTRLTTGDVRDMSVELAASLAMSELLSERGPESARMVVAIDRVENLSSDVVPVSEQWYLMERIRASTPLQALASQRNIGFVIPAEHLRQLRERAGAEAALAMERRAPTHAMRGTLRSITRAIALARTDLYSFECRIIDLASGDVVWSDSFELKRAAAGLSYD